MTFIVSMEHHGFSFANDKTETLTNKTISGAANTFSNIAVSSISDFEPPFSYVIYKDGSTYYAKSKNFTNYSNADARTLFNNVADYLNTNSIKGRILIRSGQYDFSNVSNSVTAYSNQQWVGESREGTILNNLSTTFPIFRRVGTTVSNFSIQNMTLQATAPASSSFVYTSGTIDCYFYNNYYHFIGTPGAGFLTFYDTTTSDNVPCMSRTASMKACPLGGI